VLTLRAAVRRCIRCIDNSDWINLVKSIYGQTSIHPIPPVNHVIRVRKKRRARGPGISGLARPFFSSIIGMGMIDIKLSAD